MPLYTHGSYSYWIVWLLIPLLFSHFSIVYTTRIHTLGALQHYNAWNFTGIVLILAHVAWTVDISMDILHISSGYMHFLHVTRMVNQGFTLYRFQLCLSLHAHAMLMIAIACCALWTCGFWNSLGYTKHIHSKSPSLPICIQTVYTRFAPQLSKYGVYNSSPLIVLRTGVKYCATHVHLIVFAASYRT